MRSSSPAPSARIRRAGPDDAEDWVRTYLDALAATYAGIMPPEFAIQQRAQAGEIVRRYRPVLAAQHADPDEPHRCWIAEDDAGPVAIAEVRDGPQGWEVTEGWPPAATRRQLVKLYALPSAHGSGLGQRLLDVAIASGPAYLWIMAGNPRAEGFYRRNGFVPDGLEVLAGPSWFNRPAFRMHRITLPDHPGAAPAAGPAGRRSGRPGG